VWVCVDVLRRAWIFVVVVDVRGCVWMFVDLFGCMCYLVHRDICVFSSPEAG
jgi:hypothetical protein